MACIKGEKLESKCPLLRCGNWTQALLRLMMRTGMRTGGLWSLVIEKKNGSERLKPVDVRYGKESSSY